MNGFTLRDIEKRVEVACSNMWKFNQYYSMGTQSGEEEASVWCIYIFSFSFSCSFSFSFILKIYSDIMDELGSRIRHSDNPNLNIVPFFFSERAASYSLAWPIHDIHGMLDILK